jgi:hypothetical protein
MRRVDVYVDLDGQEICLGHLDADERKLLARIRRRARTHPSWDEFDNYWTREVGEFYDARKVPLLVLFLKLLEAVFWEFYDARKVPRTVSREGTVYRVAQDQSSRLGIAEGLIRPDDSEGDLEELIRERFDSAEASCQATGLEKEAVRQFLLGKGDLSIRTLERGLARIGCRLRIREASVAQQKQASRARVG